MNKFKDNTNIPISIINKFSNIIILLEDKNKKNMIDEFYLNNKNKPVENMNNLSVLEQKL